MSEWDSVKPVGVVNAPEGVWGLAMDINIKLAWCDALESGDYKQGYGKLRNINDEFCPLGVLVDLATKAKVIAWDKLSEADCYVANGHHNSLPSAVAHWAGISEGTFYKGWGGQEFPLHWANNWQPIWRLNDTYKLPLDNIGQMIRMQY